MSEKNDQIASDAEFFVDDAESMVVTAELSAVCADFFDAFCFFLLHDLILRGTMAFPTNREQLENLLERARWFETMGRAGEQKWLRPALAKQERQNLVVTSWVELRPF